jgi:opacity protein-like surface antigen
MIRTLVVIAVLASAPMEAQDTTGLFGGVHVGYSSVKPEFTEPVFAPGSLNPTVDGLTGGALLVYRSRRIGFEAEMGFADLDAMVPGDGGDGFTKFEAQWVSRARLTLSHSAGNTLFFVGGGAAAMKLYVDDAFFEDGAPDVLVHDPSLSTLTGWTIGAGMERKIRERIFARVEGIYDRYGPVDLSPNPGEGRIEPTSTTFRAAVLFRF